MPKVISNLRSQLTAEARRQVLTNGYSAVTVRSVAEACSITTGTVYSYFKSKDALIFSFMLEDWNALTEKLKMQISFSDTNEDILYCIYSDLKVFSAVHEKLFQDNSALRAYSKDVCKRYPEFRHQIAELLIHRIHADDEDEAEFTAEFIAESLLTWTISDAPFEKICSVLEKLF